MRHKTLKNIRKILFGLGTILGVTKKGYFIPYRYAGDTPDLATSNPIIDDFFCDHMDGFHALAEEIEAWAPELSKLGSEKPPAPRWTQDWFTGLDAAAAYALVRRFKPRQILEIGSGHSTRFLVQAVADGGLDCRISCIDPAPRASISGLPVTFHRKILQDCTPQELPDLAAGDILFIDSSHIAMPGTDVDLLFSTVIPALNKGVYIHIHDITLPDPYPRQWAWRAYNEHQVVAAMMAGGGFKPVFSSHFYRTRAGDRLAGGVLEGLDIPPGALETSLWLVKESGPLAKGSRGSECMSAK